jgi:hypothetical protein
LEIQLASTIGHTLEPLFEGLEAAGCSHVFREKVSGAAPTGTS